MVKRRRGIECFSLRIGRSRFLLGIDLTPKDKDVVEIAKGFNKTFETMREDKKARSKMSSAEYLRREAREEGREEGILETALAMLKEGLPLEQVSKITRLTVSKLEKLMNV